MIVLSPYKVLCPVKRGMKLYTIHNECSIETLSSLNMRAILQCWIQWILTCMYHSVLGVSGVNCICKNEKVIIIVKFNWEQIFPLKSTNWYSHTHASFNPCKKNKKQTYRVVCCQAILLNKWQSKMFFLNPIYDWTHKIIDRTRFCCLWLKNLWLDRR